MVLVGITGDSARDNTDPLKPTIYAGFAGTCTPNPEDPTKNTMNGTEVCDSCAYKTTLEVCNKRNAYDNLKLVVTTQFTLVGALVSNAYIKVGDGDKTFGNYFTLTSSNTLVTSITWAELCSLAGDCGSGINKEVTIGIDPTSGGTGTAESYSFKVIARSVIAGPSFYTDCNTDTAVANSGYCHFEAFPGDGKLYANNLIVSPDYPATGASSVNYNGLVFFYEEQLDGESAETTINRITTGSASKELVTSQDASAPSTENRISGLTNGKRYCLVMANKDVTGIISSFTPGAADEQCAPVSEVVGLLDGKECFIATAAFGSEMAPEVNTFREFRDRFLLRHAWGKKIIQFYYKHSPYYANQIAESEVAKTLVRAALWPILFFTKMSLILGFWSAVLFSTLILAVLLGIVFYAAEKRRSLGVSRET